MTILLAYVVGFMSAIFLHIVGTIATNRRIRRIEAEIAESLALLDDTITTEGEWCDEHWATDQCSTEPVATAVSTPDTPWWLDPKYTGWRAIP